MHESYKPHPLLAQIPLTVSPFISLPTATTLPYTYKSVSSSLPPSVLADTGGSDKPRYVVSAGGHAAHPDEIIASCQALADHMKKTQTEGETAIRDWEESIRQRELAEKRRVAPGWLDRDEKLLQPEHAPSADRNHGYQEMSTVGPSTASLLDRQSAEQSRPDSVPAIAPRSEGEELDRAFGKLDMK